MSSEVNAITSAKLLPCAGNAGVPPLNLYARVRFCLRNIARETAGAASTRSSLRPLIFEEGQTKMQTSGVSRREIAKSYSVVVTRLVRTCALGRVTPVFQRHQ